jgi:hypothetical protein
MKNTELSYHKDFPQTPVSGWAGARWYAWINHRNDSGQWKHPIRKPHPFLSQRKLWCLLEIHFQGVDLIFAMPAELDQFIKIMSQNPLPSGGSLIEGRISLGRPNKHWLSRLPKQTKPWNFRQKLLKFLETDPKVSEFREFYTFQPIELKFDGYFDSFYDAMRAQGRVL